MEATMYFLLRVLDIGPERGRVFLHNQVEVKDGKCKCAGRRVEPIEEFLSEDFHSVRPFAGEERFEHRPGFGYYTRSKQ